MSTSLENWHADMARCHSDKWTSGSMWWWNDRTVWMITTYRLAQWSNESNGLLRRIARAAISAAYPLVQALSGIELWPNTAVGGGLRIHHGTGLVVAPGSVIGANCTLRQGVTIGVRNSGELECPVLRDGVDVGAYAQILGSIVLHEGAIVGAASVVLSDVPAGATVVGTPARIISRRASPL